MIRGMVMNGPTPTMLLMLRAVACRRPKPRTRPCSSLEGGGVFSKVLSQYRLSVYKPQRPENLRDVKGRTVCRLPDDRLAIGRRSLPTEEVDPECIARCGGACIH